MGKHTRGKNHKLWMALKCNRNGRYLFLTEERGRVVKGIFIPKGEEAVGWWKVMKSVY